MAKQNWVAILAETEDKTEYEMLAKIACKKTGMKRADLDLAVEKYAIEELAKRRESQIADNTGAVEKWYELAVLTIGPIPTTRNCTTTTAIVQAGNFGFPIVQELHFPHEKGVPEIPTKYLPSFSA